VTAFHGNKESGRAWVGALAAIPRASIRGLDTLIRRVRGVREFVDDKLCLVRIAMVKSGRDVTLSDGTEVTKGEVIGELHLWNEHIPPMLDDGSLFAWALRAYSLLVRSLRVLVRYLANHPEWSNVSAWRGESSFIPRGIGVPELFARLGFDVVREHNPGSLARQFIAFWDNLYWWMLAWTFDQGSLTYKSFPRLERWQIWISSDRLKQKYGSPASHSKTTVA